MEIQVDPKLEEFIKRKIDSGQAASAAEVVNDALWLLKDADEESPEDIEELRKEVAEAVEQMDRGEGEPWDVEDFKKRLLERHAQRKRAN